MSSLSSREQKEISRVKGRGKINPITYLLAFVGVGLFILYLAAAHLFNKGDDHESIRLLQAEYFHELESSRGYYSDWLADKLGEGSSATFDHISALFLDTATLVPASEDWVSSGWIGLHKGLIRATFLVIAWWKFWLLAMIVAVIWSMRSWQVYLGQDLLGRQTNGRLFYSGIRGDLKKVTSGGAPDVQVPGLACPKFVSAAEVKGTDLGKVIEHYGVASATIMKLAGVICAYKTWPAFVANRGETALLEAAYQNTKLQNHAALVLEAALSLRETYLQYRDKIDSLSSAAHDIDHDQPMTPGQYVEALKLSFNRVLTPSWKLALLEISPKELAAIVLALEAGKVMAYTDEGHSFFQSSNFPQLCARSVLHSIPEYSQEFDYKERSTIRRAIVYGSRKSIYGPVKFTLDLTPQIRAVRQWVELLMACPHELAIVSEEVELYGLICEIHSIWSKAFIDDLMVLHSDQLNRILVQSSVLFVPFAQLISYFTKHLDPKVQSRLAQLVSSVSHRQQLTIAEGAASGINRVPDYQRIFTPLTTEQISKLSKEHKLDPKNVSDWSALRIVLNYFSWLGRRVGDSTVPESSIIHLAVRKEGDSYQSLESASECHSGMVALRATRLIDRWGAHWAHKFNVVSSVSAVENMEEYEKFKRGESLDDIDPAAAETM